MATKSDIPAIAEAYQAGATRRLDSERIDRWGTSDSLEAAELAARRLLRQGALFVRRLGVTDYMNPFPANHRETIGIIGATAVVRSSDDRDRELWGQLTSDQDNSIYIHRLATHPDYRGARHAEYLLLAIAFSNCLTGPPHIRLDCAAESAGLRHYYEERIGMACVGEVTRESNGYHAALYQQKIVNLLPSDLHLSDAA